LPEPKNDVVSSEKSIKKNIENKLEPAVIYEKKTPESHPDKPDIELTQVKGIGEKRAIQLNTLGIKTVNDLANESAANISKKLKISPKITRKWKASAKKLLK
jgi:predicted flap endonuclease-1-like 5' DNA nuclease